MSLSPLPSGASTNPLTNAQMNPTHVAAANHAFVRDNSGVADAETSLAKKMGSMQIEFWDANEGSRRPLPFCIQRGPTVNLLSYPLPKNPPDFIKGAKEWGELLSNGLQKFFFPTAKTPQISFNEVDLDLAPENWSS